MLNILKLTWMVWWRLWFILALTGNEPSATSCLMIAVIFAIIMHSLFGKTIKIFPIIRLIGLKNPVVSIIHTSSRIPDKTVRENPQSDIFAGRQVIQKATHFGRNSGFEPKYLQNVNIPPIATMRGIPGKGLNQASHMSSTNVRTGQMGETNFAKALCVTNKTLAINYQNPMSGILNNIHSFWSVAMPNKDFTAVDNRISTDIDCIFVNDKEIYLVDTKFYKSGDVTYTALGNKLYCIDNATGNIVGDPKTMSRNMEIAQERFAKAFPRMLVRSMVVLVPTDSGACQINNVFWPGHIEAVTIEQALQKMAMFSAGSNKAPISVTQKIAQFVQ